MTNRKPAFAGTFYPGESEGLDETLNGFFARAGALKRDCIAVVSPHAGYTFSGLTAAHAIGSLRPAKKFIILGPNHTGRGPDVSVWPAGSWKTPLGRCEVDRIQSLELSEAFAVKPDTTAQEKEHSIEVQLPFLQKMFGGFSFVPVCIMAPGYQESFMKRCVAMGKMVAHTAKSHGTSIIASSDFSHYVPAALSCKIDGLAARKIMELDVEGFFRAMAREGNTICGFGPIAVLMAAAKELGLKGRLLHKSHSGHVTGDDSEVVAYYAIGFY
jgi:hypothetical protein